MIDSMLFNESKYMAVDAIDNSTLRVPQIFVFAVIAETVTVTNTTKGEQRWCYCFSLNDANGLQLGPPIGR
jgi:hypothetical protein